MSTLKKINYIIIYIIFFLGLLLIDELAWACPMCKEALAGGPTAVAYRLANGFFWSILLMMSAPFILMGVLTTVIYRAAKKKGKRLW